MRRYDLVWTQTEGIREDEWKDGEWVRYEDVAALVEAAYREGFAGGHCEACGFSPYAQDVDHGWDKSDARAALARKEEAK